MGIVMKNLVTLIFALVVSSQSLAEFKPDFDKGFEAYQQGDYETALLHWVTLANNGHSTAQLNLGVMYDRGYGVLTSNIKAYMWWNLAAFNGHKIAATNKDSITKEMTNEQIAKAQELSQRCLDSGYKDC